jgi:Domain of unknown function (DUF4150)/GHH signature containing HNH/Endo VII superfamily nuclease toxin  2
MADDVFANTREITCQAGSSKSIAAFPDVCMTPPENPATPPGVPVPYPNFGMASDTTEGSASVKINQKQVMLKNQSYFKKSSGDEAGCAAKKGVVSSVNRGKVYFVSWSPDVKIEGMNVVRHLDMTTHNHGSAANTVPWPHTGRMDLINSVKGCEKEKQKIKDECGDPINKNKSKCPNPKALDAAWQEHETACAKKNKAAMAVATKKVNAAHEKYAVAINRNPCTKALQCALVPYDKGREGACCPHSTPDHLVPAAQFGPDRGAGHPKYKADKAPCMCATGGAHTATHGLLGQARTDYMVDNGFEPNSYEKSWTVADSCKCGSTSASEVTGCSQACLDAQLRKGHKDMKVKLNEKISTRKESVTRDLSDIKSRLGPPT